MAALHSDNPSIQRIADDVSGIRLKQVTMEGQHNLLNQKVDHLEDDFNEKHDENKETNREIKNDIKEVKAAIDSINITVAKWSVGSGIILAVVMKLIEKWVKV